MTRVAVIALVVVLASALHRPATVRPSPAPVAADPLAWVPGSDQVTQYDA